MVTRRVSEVPTAIPRARFGLPLNQQAVTGRVAKNLDFFCENHFFEPVTSGLCGFVL